MFRRNSDVRSSSASLLWYAFPKGHPNSTGKSPDNADRRRSTRFVIYVVIVLITIGLCSQLLSIAVVSNSTGIGSFFKKAEKSWAVVVIACNRPWYLEPVLKQLLSLPMHQLSTVSIYLSQDGYDEGVEEVANQFQNELTHWQRPRPSNDQTASTINLAKHYKWTLDKLFFEEDFSHVIILEDDLLVSNDFLSYFKHTFEILDKDGRVMCVSAHNDIGRKDVATDPSRLFRTSFFPGLGWMLKKALWKELSPMWPTDHFDWWLRSSAASRGRVCISPEVNRVRHIGHIGVNCNKHKQGQSDYNVNLSLSALPSDSFYESKEPVEYTSLESLLRPTYDRRLSDMVARAKLLSPFEADKIRRLIDDTIPAGANQADRLFLTVFRDRAEYESLQKVLFLYDFKQQRSFYRGILEITLPRQGKLLVANARTCVFLPPDLRSTPQFGVVPEIGRAHV